MSITLIEAILMKKGELEAENERLASQLAWLAGVVEGVCTRPNMPLEIAQDLEKALHVIGWGRTKEGQN